MAMARTSAGDGGELSSAEARQLSRYSSGEARVNYELKSLTCRDDNGRRWKENEAALATQVCVYTAAALETPTVTRPAPVQPEMLVGATHVARRVRLA